MRNQRSAAEERRNCLVSVMYERRRETNPLASTELRSILDVSKRMSVTFQAGPEHCVCLSLVISLL